jgi:serine/threonine protein kinase
MIKRIEINPTRLSEDEAKLLHQFLQAGEGSKIKDFFVGQSYPFKDNGQDIFITFTHNLARITEGYTHVLKLKDGIEAKGLKDYEIGWLHEEGQLKVYWRDGEKTWWNGDRSSNNKINKILKQLNGEGKDSSNRKLIKDIASTYKLPRTIKKDYTYVVFHPTKDKIGEGANGAVYRVSGELKHHDNGMKYSAIEGKVIKKQAVKGIDGGEATDISEDNVKKQESEHGLNQLVYPTGQKITFVKNNRGTKKASYMVQHKFPGETLEKILAERSLTLKERYILSVKLIEALKRLHDKGILHRDIKPSNIMVDLDTMEVNLPDLGEGRRIHKQDKMAVGTPSYMSHEMLLFWKTAGKESDICSLGLVLKELWGDQKRKEELEIRGGLGSYDARTAELALAGKEKEEELKNKISCHFEETISTELGKDNTTCLNDILMSMTHPIRKERSLTKAWQGLKGMAPSLKIDTNIFDSDLFSQEISDLNSEETDLGSKTIDLPTLQEIKLEKKPGFFEKRPWLKDILIGAGMALAAVAGVAIIAASWGVATPFVLGVGATVGASVGLSGTVAIGVGLGMITAGAVIVNSIIAGAVGKMRRYFEGKNKPPRELNKDGAPSVESQRSLRISQEEGLDNGSQSASRSDRDLAEPQPSSDLDETGGSPQPNPEKQNADPSPEANKEIGSPRISRKPGSSNGFKPASRSDRDLAESQPSSDLPKTGGSPQSNPENQNASPSPEANKEMEGLTQWKGNKNPKMARITNLARITDLPTIQEKPDNLVKDEVRSLQFG